MGPRMFGLLLLGVFLVLFMDEGSRVMTVNLIRICNYCDHYDGYKCLGGMGTCWKFNLGDENRSCLTQNFYLYDRLSDLYLYDYARLSCEYCEEGMLQLFQDIFRETFCCIDKNRCNNGRANLDMTHLTEND